MIQEIITYKNIVSNLEDLMNNSPFKKNYIIEKAGIPSPTFYRKLKTQTFTPDEMLSIAKILSPEENFRLELKADIEQAKREYNEGNFITHEEMLLELKTKGII
jgi:predicted transcriptional regulator